MSERYCTSTLERECVFEYLFVSLPLFVSYLTTIVCIASCCVLTCNVLIITSFVDVCIHTCELCCLFIDMGVCTWSQDLFEVRHAHVRNYIPHLQARHMSIQHGKYYFLTHSSSCRTAALLAFAIDHVSTILCYYFKQVRTQSVNVEG